MYIEAITICVGYADFLAETIKFNRPHFDRWLIVTTQKDKETIDLCQRRGMECLQTDDFYRNGNTFDKALGIDRGLSQLTHKGKIIHQDADIVLPPHFKESLNDIEICPASIYGCDRFMVRNWDSWQKLKNSSYFSDWSRCHHHNVCFPEGFPVGARWADTVQGYVPIGFFQMWDGPYSMRQGVRKRYAPYGHNDAARTDVQFGLTFDRKHRHLLPEIIVAHLESEKSPVGANWSGRTSKPFGPIEIITPQSKLS